MSLICKNEFITKTFFYKGNFRLSLDENHFRLHPMEYLEYDNIFAILMDITSEEFKGHELRLRISKVNKFTTMKLLKINSTNLEEKIIEIILEKSKIILSSNSNSSKEDSSQNEKESDEENETEMTSLPKAESTESMETESSSSNDDEIESNSKANDTKSLIILEKEYKSIHKIFKTNSECRLVFFTKFIEAKFEIDDTEFEEYKFLTNPSTNVYNALELQYYEGICKEFGIYKNYRLVDKSTVFSSLDSGSPVELDVSQRCQAMNLNECPLDTVEIPWIDNSVILARRLATVLDREDIGGGIRFYNGNKEVMEESVNFDFEKLITKENKDVIPIYYYLYDFKVLCTPLLMECGPFELTIPDNCTVADLKRRLQGRLKIEWDRFVICRDQKRLRQDTIIIVDKDQIQYLVASVLDKDTKKELIGEGGFGQIFKCTIPYTNETIALKKFTSLLHDESEWKSFIREWGAMKEMTPHVNVLKYRDLYLDADDVCIAMQYMPRGSLRHYLNEIGPLDEDEIRRFSKGIVRGVKHLHEHKINHRDIKGDNVLLDENNTVKLCDFGLSIILTKFSFGELSEGVYQTNKCGSLRWMAPEIFVGGKYGLKVDIWSIGATVVEMITGKVPFHGLTDTQAAAIIGSEKRIDFVSPRSMSPDFELFVKNCLIADVSERPNIHKLLTLSFVKD